MENTSARETRNQDSNRDRVCPRIIVFPSRERTTTFSTHFRKGKNERGREGGLISAGSDRIELKKKKRKKNTRAASPRNAARDFEISRGNESVSLARSKFENSRKTLRRKNCRHCPRRAWKRGGGRGSKEQGERTEKAIETRATRPRLDIGIVGADFLRAKRQETPHPVLDHTTLACFTA